MKTTLEREMLEFVKKRGMQYGQLDILVEDIKCQQANRVNNSGVLAQLRYLLTRYSPVELRNAVRRERKMLDSYKAVKYSKCKEPAIIRRNKTSAKQRAKAAYADASRINSILRKVKT